MSVWRLATSPVKPSALGIRTQPMCATLRSRLLVDLPGLSMLRAHGLGNRSSRFVRNVWVV